MKGLFRLLKIVAYEHLDQRLLEMRAIEKNHCDDIRRKALDKISLLDPVTESPKIVEIMKDMHNMLDTSYAIEHILIDFVIKLKS